jgi:putative membrane protein
MMYGWWEGSSMPWFGMILGPIMMIALIAVAVLLVVWAVRAFGPASSGPADSRPLDMLKQRYARGEIDRAEFEERKQVLSGS